MTGHSRFRAHLYAATGAVVLGVAVAAIHVPVLVIVNAALFGANIMAAWMVKR